MKKESLKNRDINWLYFNERVLLEADNPDTPLFERLKFLAIFSSNLDEYFKVRISQLRQIKEVRKPLRKKLISKPNQKLKFILKKVDQQQEYFGTVVKKVLSELRENQIFIKRPENLSDDQKQYLTQWFLKEVASDCIMHTSPDIDDLKDGQIYLVVEFPDESFDILLIPTTKHPRFVKLPGDGHQYSYLDDVLRLNLDHFYPNRQGINSYSIKISRDAELYLEDDYGDIELAELIYDSLGKRKSGQPTRLLYDKKMPPSLKNTLKERLELSEVDMLSGGRYHNFSDFFRFPRVPEDGSLSYKRMPPLMHPTLSLTDNIFKVLEAKDQLVHFPYQTFDVFERFLQEAAVDPMVKTIKMSLYRIADQSKVTDSLLLALENGKEVLLFVEAKARFDEKNNIKWGRVLKDKGATVHFSVPNIKVHSKIALVERQNESFKTRYGYIGTGNFNAKTAKLYCDHGLFTANKKITSDLAQIFWVLERKLIVPKLKHLLVSPYNTRSTLLELINNEMENAKLGKPAKITVKMNSLEDPKMIKAIYRAAEAGVEVRMLVRGFCCLIPKPKDQLEENEKPIFITSIIDRYLEHGRIYLFENGGDEKMFMGSADWMTRNLDRRIEVLTPIIDSDIFEELKHILTIQLSDNIKARIIDEEDSNKLVACKADEDSVRSQYAIYDFLKQKLDDNS